MAAIGRRKYQRKMAAAMNAMLTKYLKDFSVPQSTATVEPDLLSSLANAPLSEMPFLAEPEPEVDIEEERRQAFQEGQEQARRECEERFSGELAAIAEEGADTLAAYISEPVMASGGVIVPPPGYHRRCREICRANGILYIADEVVTAFGRLGHWFASQDVFDFVPDIITSAKGLTSGYQPLGAAIISDRLIEDLVRKDNANLSFKNGYTYSGHPVCCAAALKNIEIIEREGLLEHVRELTPHFQERLRGLMRHEIVADARGMGLVGCVEGRPAPEGREKERLAADSEFGRRVDRKCEAMGLLVRPLINMCVMSPPLIITRAQIDDLVSILHEGISRTMDDLRAEGIWQG